MKRKNLAVKKVARTKLIKTKDKKILVFYKRFEKNIYKSVKNEKFAIAVSGGSPVSIEVMHRITVGHTVGFKFWHNGVTSGTVNDNNNHTYFKGVLLG